MNNEFQWTDELVKEFIHRTFAPNRSEHSEVNEFMDKFKTSKQPPEHQPKRIEVVCLLHQHDYLYNIEFNSLLGRGDGEKIKAAIEQAINKDSLTENKCTCKVGEPYNSVTCPIHGVYSIPQPSRISENKDNEPFNETKAPNPLEKECQAIYNQGVEHSISIISRFINNGYFAGNYERLIAELRTLKHPVKSS